MKTRPFWFYRQSGVIPYRVKDGRVEILLVTSRNRGRWVIPKGVIEIGMTAEQSAMKEAYEEAGIRGEIVGGAMGEFTYEKWNGLCIVEVFAMHVTEVLKQWPEDDERHRRWMDIDGAAEAVREDELREMIVQLAQMVPPV
jgi:phosphohistidine phosphatase